MKPRVVLLVFFLGLNLHVVYSQKVSVIGFDELQSKFIRSDDTLRIFNFWATWCKPCVEEMPCFLRAAEQFRAQKVIISLVSLDFRKHLESRLIPFIQERNIRLPVLLLDAPDPNQWIDKVSPQWLGAIPATLFIKGNKTFFHESEFTCEELNLLINKYLEL